MRNFIKKNWSLIGFIIAFAIDNLFGILKNSGLSIETIELIKGFGAIISGYYWTTKHNVSLVKNNGGGAVIPSKPY